MAVDEQASWLKWQQNGHVTNIIMQQLGGIKRAIGASHIDDLGVQIWYYVSSGRYESGGRQYSVKQTTVIQCDSSKEARELVATIRQASCWSIDGTRPPRVTAYINPVSGKGRAAPVFSTTVLPILEQAAGMEVKVIQLQHAKQATELVFNLDLQSTDMLVCVGGDGTLWECLQGLLSRPDWQRATQLPIAHIPAGSGNGVAASCGILDPVTAALAICKGRTTAMDVVSAVQGNNRYFMTSMMTYGLLSNLILDTQHLRWLGELRLNVGAAWQILRKAGYSCRMAYLPADATGDDVTISGDAAQRDDISQPSTAPGTSSTIPLPILQSLGGTPPSISSDPSSLPPGWKHLELSGVQAFCLANIPWIAQSYCFNPEGAVNSGHMNLVYTSRRMSRLEGIRLLLAARKGRHLENDGVECRAMKAVVFEALSGGTCVALDGEVVGLERMYLEVHPGLCRFVVAPEWQQGQGV